MHMVVKSMLQCTLTYHPARQNSRFDQHSCQLSYTLSVSQRRRRLIKAWAWLAFLLLKYCSIQQCCFMSKVGAVILQVWFVKGGYVWLLPAHSLLACVRGFFGTGSAIPVRTQNQSKSLQQHMGTAASCLTSGSTVLQPSEALLRSVHMGLLIWYCFSVPACICIGISD